MPAQRSPKGEKVKLTNSAVLGIGKSFAQYVVQFDPSKTLRLLEKMPQSRPWESRATFLVNAPAVGLRL